MLRSDPHAPSAPRDVGSREPPMPHSVNLISTIAAGLGLALVLGYLAVRLRIPPLVGYLLAGIVIGPATPGFVADVGLAGQLSEIGVMLMMFGVGLHFSLGDLMSVRRIAIPGALVQIAAATSSVGRAQSALSRPGSTRRNDRISRITTVSGK